MKVKFILVISALLAICSITACQNTIEGFGKDMKHSGQEIEKSARS